MQRLNVLRWSEFELWNVYSVLNVIWLNIQLKMPTDKQQLANTTNSLKRKRDSHTKLTDSVSDFSKIKNFNFHFWDIYHFEFMFGILRLWIIFGYKSAMLSYFRLKRRKNVRIHAFHREENESET